MGICKIKYFDIRKQIEVQRFFYIFCSEILFVFSGHESLNYVFPRFHIYFLVLFRSYTKGYILYSMHKTYNNYNIVK